MGLFSRDRDDRREDQRGGRALSDEQAVERYRYMLRTAPPDQIEQAHQEAFEQLSPEQRRLALEQLATVAPDEARRASDDPRSLARLATRTEIRQPGMLERLFGGVRPGGYGGAGIGGGGFGGGGFGMGMGGMLAGSLLASVAGTFIGSAMAHSFFDHNPFPGGDTADASGSSDLAGSDSAGNEGDYQEAGGFEDQGGLDDGMDSGFDGGGDFGDII
ncbi:MAG TPA: hypothetical protein VEQ63_15655 [Bryobacteraceae bacterium]|nr:hypothetical protein [Bryobacteraceae bacterium]